MTDKKLSKEAYDELMKEKEEEQKKEFKQYFKDTLQEIEIQKKNKEIIEEKIRILNKDLDDLKEGNLEKIKERQEKSPLAKEVSKVIVKKIIVKVIQEPDWYRGTYPIIIPLTPSHPYTWTVGDHLTQPYTCEGNSEAYLTTTGSTISKTFYF